MAENPIAQSLITVMGKPPRLTHEDVETLYRSVKEGKIPINLTRPLSWMNINKNE